jgi:hypothetical protein
MKEVVVPATTLLIDFTFLSTLSSFSRHPSFSSRYFKPNPFFSTGLSWPTPPTPLSSSHCPNQTFAQNGGPLLVSPCLCQSLLESLRLSQSLTG